MRAGPRGYSTLQIVLHWLIAGLVVFQLIVNDGMQDAFDDRIDAAPVDEMGAAILHIAIGLSVLGLAIVRVFVRLTRGAPEHLNKLAVLNWLSGATHLLLYGFIFAMPVTGALAWFFGLEISAELHELGRLILIPLIGFHVLGALVEQFVLGNNSLLRMLRPDRD